MNIPLEIALLLACAYLARQHWQLILPVYLLHLVALYADTLPTLQHVVLGAVAFLIAHVLMMLHFYPSDRWCVGIAGLGSSTWLWMRWDTIHLTGTAWYLAQYFVILLFAAAISQALLHDFRNPTRTRISSPIDISIIGYVVVLMLIWGLATVPPYHLSMGVFQVATYWSFCLVWNFAAAWTLWKQFTGSSSRSSSIRSFSP